MLILLDENIDISPKLILWNKFFNSINKEMIVSFLKNDILLLEYDIFKKIYKIKSNIIIANILNLNYLLMNSKNEAEFDDLINKAVNNLNTLKKIQKVAVTTEIIADAKEKLINNNIKYYMLKDHLNIKLFDIIKELASPIHISKYCRTNLRIQFKSNIYKSELKIQSMTFKAVCKDISLTGLSLYLDNINDFNNFEIGSFINVTIDFKIIFLEITNAMIVRKDKKNNLIGLKIDIKDRFMLDDNNAMILESIIESWVTKLVDSESLTINNFM